MAFWYPYILKFPELELQASEQRGLISCRWGNVEFITTAFDGEPPDKCLIDLRWGLSSVTAFQLFNGTILRKSYEYERVVYEVFKPDLVVNALDTGVDENGESCTIPVIFGDVQFMTPQRTGSDTEYRYYRPDFEGVIGTDWHAYDDGVLIDDNWTDDGITVARSVSVVGELTFSGTARKTTLADVFEWGCSRFGIELDNKHETAIALDFVIDSQKQTLDVLDEVAYYCNHRFYIKDDVLTLIDLDYTNGSSLLGSFGFKNPVYEWAERVKSFTAEWETNEGDGASAVYQQSHKLTLNGEHKLVGADEKMPFIYNLSESAVQTRMEKILAYIQLPICTLQMPIIKFPLPGEEIIFNDIKGNNKITATLKTEGVSMSYGDKLLTVTGRVSMSYL